MINKEKALLMLDENIENISLLNEFFNDFDVMLKATQKDGTTLALASQELRNDPEIVLAALISANGKSEYEKVADCMSTHLYIKLFNQTDIKGTLEKLIIEKKVK